MSYIEAKEIDGELWVRASDINKDEEILDEDEEDVVHYILIEEDSHWNLTWDSSYETLEEFMEVMHIVAEEVQEPVIISVPLH